MNIRPTTLILTLSDAPQDARDLYGEQRLTCACCGRTNQVGRPVWALPGLCNECANHVESVTVAAPHVPLRQTPLFETAGPPR